MMTRSFSPYIYADEAASVDNLLQRLPWEAGQARRIKDNAASLIERIRAYKTKPGQLESFLREYSLNTDEGIALMCLAEALLRIPDKKTMNALIRDKMAAAEWARNPKTQDKVVKAAGFGLLMTRKTLNSAISRIGEPFIREAMLKAMRVMGGQFVLGQDIAEAMQKAAPYAQKGYRMSYDILGEGARTAIDADRYFQSYAQAIEYIGQRSGKNTKPDAISVKLSALHPRYAYAQRDVCVPALVEKLRALCVRAAHYDLALTVDAEEVDRLELSFDIIEEVLRDRSMKDWEGFGVAIQAYSKRAIHVVDYYAILARGLGRRLQARLVKGAYWDTEIKRAQVLGLDDYPVFTRKVNTDLSYLACAQTLFENKGAIYPLLGTHNAYTAAAIIEMAKAANAPFEFQRLHGMGEALSDILLEENAASVGVYAPVGPHEDLLAYLVRRLLENGANTSFINHLLNPDEPVENLVGDPVDEARKSASKRHPQISLPSELYIYEAPHGRRNSAGMDLSAPASVDPLRQEIARFYGTYDAPALIGGRSYKETVPQEVKNPAHASDNLGRYWPANKGLVDKAFRIATDAFPAWRDTDVNDRADIMKRFANLLEKNKAELMALCIREAGKIIPDALAEIREAVDYCRYYANRARHDFRVGGHVLPGPTGETNVLKLQGRGVFACISPWNFPLAIFTGQITAALMAGNCVLAKPAEQTPLIAFKTIQLLHEAGVPETVLHYLPGDGLVGAAAAGHQNIAGVAFTGSTAVAREINMSLADNRGPIAPLIAETGGQNAMLVDSSALPEQVVDDVLLSAFGSAGQRCSSLRILYLQQEIADKILRLLQGGMAELRIGDPADLSTDIGPVIDEEALGKLISHRENLKGFGKLIYEVPMDPHLSSHGHYFAPCAYELNNIKGLIHEVFGPVLHIVRYARDEIDDVIEDINATGYGLTLGVHSRIDAFQEKIASQIRAGNVYVNRSIIGAVVGTQPFGGQGLSGTGPKAGGPHYLPRFATERVISVNTTAAGGNTTLVSLAE